MYILLPLFHEVRKNISCYIICHLKFAMKMILILCYFKMILFYEKGAIYGSLVKNLLSLIQENFSTPKSKS